MDALEELFAVVGVWQILLLLATDHTEGAMAVVIACPERPAFQVDDEERCQDQGRDDVGHHDFLDVTLAIQLFALTLIAVSSF